ncbi:MAG: hypothetical protein AB7O68_08220 [Pirellulales bacterium]
MDIPPARERGQKNPADTTSGNMARHRVETLNRETLVSRER